MDDWEFIPDDGFLEIHDDGGKQIYSRKYVKDSSNISSVFNMNYFKSPSPNSQKFVESTEVSRVPKQLVPLPINFQQNSPEVVKEITISVHKAPNIGGGGALEEAEQDLVSQVFFKKMKENEFVDMKMDSPKSGNRGILPQIEAGKFQFEEKDDDQVQAMEATPTIEEEDDQVITWEQSNDINGVNMWKWGLTGIGAICSFGVAATATICFIILGSVAKNRQHQHNHNQKLRFQIYADDKVCD